MQCVTYHTIHVHVHNYNYDVAKKTTSAHFEVTGIGQLHVCVPAYLVLLLDVYQIAFHQF